MTNDNLCRIEPWEMHEFISVNVFPEVWNQWYLFHNLTCLASRIGFLGVAHFLLVSTCSRGLFKPECNSLQGKGQD